ncbi:hypothetical protein CCR80_13420, partial [Rhodothalassium salexigens]|uniref:hypothetical protein n=2 Tax=Rhodothalassium salexigens TaxID=1086 RepID=UPI001911FA34
DANNSDPTTPDPFVEAVLQEVGLSAEGLTPKGLDQVAVDRFALVVSLSPEAHHRLCRDRADPDQPVEYWPVQDPGDIGGSREQQLAGYRLLRDQLARKIAERFDFTPPGRA